MNAESSGDLRPEFDPTVLQGAKVRCRNPACGAEYICTPFDDYYGSQGATDDNGVFVDGQCEPCMLAGA